MSNNKSVIELAKDDEGLVAKVPREHFKSMFYLFSGKPDSRVKLFNEPVEIKLRNIIDLNRDVTRKLATHHIDMSVTKATVSYSVNEFAEFGTWVEFEQHEWDIPESIDEIVVEWEFYVDIPTFNEPQRHKLMVRISSEVKPSKFMQLLTSGSSDKFEEMDSLASPIMCRVDFVNTLISKELINVVTDWQKKLSEPEILNTFLSSMRIKRHEIAVAIHHITPFMFALFWVSLVLWVDSNIYNNSIPILAVSIWIFFGIYSLSPIRKISHFLASAVYSSLEKCKVNHVVFLLTSGDEKNMCDQKNHNKKSFSKFISRTIFAAILNVSCGILASYLFVNS
ncbi:hypothetical protein N474_25585 [Pseudoalteromonas luteoviolacea CPMOR-2]|uniref:hypothetical protein n=1 Tax=Pseudoalteromonas luteoviolacea TaxID=43657 RepID=UPI0007B07881|nr:hypothetical protein [Pseudoalteromonas luteoviolacea]KZN58424.1 hypothetical protein N474_25585 [Pseudoalteromonas luteoviolacea CPMOR-2]